jgi:hypothetical protein
VVYFEIQSRHPSTGTEENHKNNQDSRSASIFEPVSHKYESEVLYIRLVRKIRAFMASVLLFYFTPQQNVP